jgi:hypothetical protein
MPREPGASFRACTEADLFPKIVIPAKAGNQKPEGEREASLASVRFVTIQDGHAYLFCHALRIRIPAFAGMTMK